MISSLPAPTATGRAHWLLTRLPGWAKILTVGASLWALSVGVLIATGDEYVVAAVALGAFVVPSHSPPASPTGPGGAPSRHR